VEQAGAVLQTGETDKGMRFDRVEALERTKADEKREPEKKCGYRNFLLDRSFSGDYI